MSDVYFWPNNEIHQSVGWMLLFFGLFEWMNDKNWQSHQWLHLVMGVCLLLAILSHVLIAVPLIFLWIYLLLENRNISPFYFGGYSFLMILFFGFRIWLSYNSWYDGVKLEGVKQISPTTIIGAFWSEQANSMYQLSLIHI